MWDCRGGARKLSRPKVSRENLRHAWSIEVDSQDILEREREIHYIVPANKADQMCTVSKPSYTRANESLMK